MPSAQLKRRARLSLPTEQNQFVPVPKAPGVFVTAAVNRTSLTASGRSSFLPLDVREAIHTMPDWGAEEISTSSDKGVNSPPQLLSPKTAQKEIKVFVFPNWWIACSHNPQRSVYTAPTGMFWLITYSYLGEKLISCAWLHRRRGSSEGRSGKDTNPPHTIFSLGWNSLAISCPTPVLPVLWYIFLGKNLTLCQRHTPAEAEDEVKKGKPYYLQPFFSLHWLLPELHVISFWPQRKIDTLLVEEYNSTVSQKNPEPEYRDKHTNSTLALFCLPAK